MQPLLHSVKTVFLERTITITLKKNLIARALNINTDIIKQSKIRLQLVAVDLWHRIGDKELYYESDSTGSRLCLDSSSSFIAPECSTGVNTDITISILVNAHVSAGISLLSSTCGCEQNVGQTGVRPSIKQSGC